MKFLILIVSVFLKGCNSIKTEYHFDNSTDNFRFFFSFLGGSHDLTTMQMIQKYGYPAEKHTVTTEDGYILEMHRIPNNKHSNANNNKPPVLLQHGLLGSSADFFIISSKHALPFMLSDLGFDVWLGNMRGNVYSRAHANISPNSLKFWDFTWHESGVHDTTAEINYILNHTQKKKIIYLGYSMGTTVFFVLESILPQYAEKIEVALLMAPVAYMESIKSDFVVFLTEISEFLKLTFDLLEGGEFLPTWKMQQEFVSAFCTMTTANSRFCLSLIFLLTGSDYEQFDLSLLPTFLHHFPCGYSAKGVNHFAQLKRSGKFRQYDYGESLNLQRYGTPEPPDYDLGRIQTPTYLYVGKNDFLSDFKDVRRLLSQLKNDRKLRVIGLPNFSHLDFLISKDIKKLVFDFLIQDLMNHLGLSN